LPIAALIGGAAVVAAGLTELVAVPDAVVLVDCVVGCWCDDVALLLDSAAEEDSDEFCVFAEEVEVVIVVKVDDIVEVVDSVVVGFLDEDADAAEVEEAEATPVDSEIKLPPLDNNVTVCSPLTTIVGAVTVVCAAPLLCKLPELVADIEVEALPLTTTLDITEVLVVVKSNVYVVLGSKLDGNVAKADESTETALVVCDCCSVAVAEHPAMLSAQAVMVVKSVVAVVSMGITTASVEEGGIEIVAVRARRVSIEVSLIEGIAEKASR
jgi:hypothetical protein